jgi:hypothetical protein
MIEINAAYGHNEIANVTLPDASEIPVASVAKAAVEAQEADARMTQLGRELVAAKKAIDTAKQLVATKAAELSIKKKELPKDIRRAIKDAEEVAADAQIAADASGEAFRHAYAALVAEVNANRAALETAALQSAERSLQRMAAAREAFKSASNEAYAGFGLLGMFSENDRTGAMKLKYRDPMGSKRGFYVTQALEEMSKAVGHSNLELAAYKRGESPTKRELEAADDGEE